MTHAENAPGRLPADRKGLRQDILQRLACRQPFLEFIRMGGQRRIRKILKSRLHRVDLVDGLLHTRNFFIVIIAQKAFQESPQNRTTPQILSLLYNTNF